MLIAVWIVSGLLALAYLASAAIKILRPHDKIVETSPGARCAHAITATEPTGFRLCGIVDEPPRPSPPPSPASPTSV